MTSEDKPLVLVRVCGPTEAEMIQEMLQNNGIDCTLQGEVSAATLPATGDLDEVRVWVNADDGDKARELVDAFFTPIAKGEVIENGPFWRSDPGKGKPS